MIKMRRTPMLTYLVWKKSYVPYLLLGVIITLNSLCLPAISLANVQVNVSYVRAGQFPKVSIICQFVEDRNVLDYVEQSKIEIVVNGKRLNNWFVSALSKSSENIALVLIVDNGKYVTPRVLEDFKDVVGQLAHKKSKGDYVGLTLISGAPTVLQPLSKDHLLLRKAVATIQKTDEEPALYEAILQGLSRLNDLDAAMLKYLVVATSGKEGVGNYSSDEVVNLSRKYGIPITIIGLSDGDSYNKFGFSSKLAHSTGGDFYVVKDKNEMFQTYSMAVPAYLKQQIIQLDLDQIDETEKVSVEICYRAKIDRKYCREVLFDIPKKLPLDKAKVPIAKPAAKVDMAEEHSKKSSSADIEKVSITQEQPSYTEKEKSGPNYAYIFLVGLVGMVVLVLAYRVIKVKYAEKKIRQKYNRDHQQIIHRPKPLSETIVEQPAYQHLLENLTEKITVAMTGNQISIGNRQDNDIVLNDKFVSRKHALLKLVNNEWSIVDLGSTNGVYINDEKLKNGAVLRANDIIKIGNVFLKYIKK